MISVATVLRSGAEYKPIHVRALRNSLRPHLLMNHRLVCFTDLQDEVGEIKGVDAVPLKHGWPGKFSLVEWWRPGIFEGRVLAVGLDTLFVDNIYAIACYSGPLAGINDLYTPDKLASGVMAWTGDEAAHLYETFREDADGIMEEYNRVDPWMRTQIPRANRLQDYFPDAIVSFKAHARKSIPKGAKIVCFHGRPRPSDPEAGWGYEMWRENAGLEAAS